MNMYIFLVLLIFGNLTDIFTNRTFDLCKDGVAMFAPYCPGVVLTPANFFNEIGYMMF